jgi:hypothetical protein
MVPAPGGRTPADCILPHERASENIAATDDVRLSACQEGSLGVEVYGTWPRHLTPRTVRAIDRRSRAHGGDAPCPSAQRPGPIDAVFRFPAARAYAGCRDAAHRGGGRGRLQSDRLSRRTGLGLDAGGRAGCPRGACRNGTAAAGALVFCPSRYSVGGGGHSGHAQGDCELAAERRASRCGGDLHDDRYRLLPALGARLGPGVGIARCQPGLDGASPARARWRK